jgi:hypothetical protein
MPRRNRKDFRERAVRLIAESLDELGHGELSSNHTLT